MELKSISFNHNEDIPQKYTCDGENINPALLISKAPESAKSLVLIMDDPDATGGGIFDHWILWNIAPDTTEIKEASVPEGAVQGTNDFGRQEYGGPCPPQGNPKHRYMFKLYAIDSMLDIPAGSKKGIVEQAMDGYVLEQATLIGLYGR
jgi:hypothetical protein